MLPSDFTPEKVELPPDVPEASSDITAAQSPAQNTQITLREATRTDISVEELTEPVSLIGEAVVSPAAAVDNGADADQDSRNDEGDGMQATPEEELPSVQEGGDDSGNPPRDGHVAQGGAEGEEGETSNAPEATSFQVSEGLVVDQRHVNGTPVTVALSEQSPDQYEEIAETMRDCDVVALCWPGLNSYDRRQLESQFTDFVSAEPDPVLAESIRDHVDRSWNFEPAGILRHLEGSGAKVVLIDVAGDDSAYHALESTRLMATHASEAITDLAPLEQARDLASITHVVTADVSMMRKRVLAAQMQRVAEENGTPDGSVSIGVVTDMANHQALAELGSEASPRRAALLSAAVESQLGYHGQAIVAHTRGDTERAAALTERALLKDYLQLYALERTVGETESAVMARGRAATQIIGELDDAECATVLEAIGEQLVDPTVAYETRFRSVRDTLLNTLKPIYESKRIA